MKLKKLTALLLAGIMALSLTACGKSDAPAEKKDETPVESSEPAADDAQEPADENNDDQTAAADLSGELVVWTLANDLISFADKFMDNNFYNFGPNYKWCVTRIWKVENSSNIIRLWSYCKINFKFDISSNSSNRNKWRSNRFGCMPFGCFCNCNCIIDEKY